MSPVTEDISNLPSLDTFIQQIQTLKSQVPAVLADFEKYYVFYNKNPENPEYQQIFQSIKGNLNNINAKSFTLSNDVQTNIDKINKKLFELDILIRKEKKQNKELKLKLGIVGDEKNTSTELITNYVDMYESEYLNNWALFFSILVAITFILKTYKNSGVNNLA